MKTIRNLSTLLLAAMFVFSCRDTIEDTYLVNEPVYMSYDELRSSFNVDEGEDIIQPGKIYFKDDLIFVNEYKKGIHVIDNTDPENPEVIRFIEIPGNIDISVKDNTLYADSYVDLLTIDISDIQNITEVDRDTGVFPYIIPEYESGILEPVDESRGVIVRYNVTEKTEKVEIENRNFIRFGGRKTEDMAYSASPVKSNTSGGSNDFGVGGSMARFTLYDDYLYTVNNSSLKLFDVSQAGNPVFANDIYIGWDIETIFPNNNKLFIGSRSGMYIYSLSNPAEPQQISAFIHASACDPVVVEGNLAFVTLRGGNLCGAISSQLDVLDISDIKNPELLKTYPMEEPYGLGIDNKILFICDGNAGLKIYDATDPLKIAENKIIQYDNINAFDVIPLGEVLVMIGTDGLYQYDYSSIEKIRQLSFIPIDNRTD